MTTTEENATGTANVAGGAASVEFKENIKRIEELSERLVSAFSNKRQTPLGMQAPSSELTVKAAQTYLNDVSHHPSKIFEHQVALWGKTLQHYLEAGEALTGGHLDAPEDPKQNDPRFKNPLWYSHPYFNFVKQQYQMSAKALNDIVDDIEGLDARDHKRVSYFTQQVIDLMSPTNFLPTNPDALERAVETDGLSLVKGLENLVRDIEANNGELVVKLADDSAFEVGGNLATTPGQVVFRNRMMELIQYSPTTEKVHAVPLIIFPPWINKFYILDLKAKNSLIKWIVEQGYTVFVVSWVNPTAEYADVGVDTYIEEGYLRAMDVVKQITGQNQLNAIGYCIAGTTLNATMALMSKRGDRSLKSATLFTTLTDFSDQGEFEVFLSDDFVNAIEEEVSQHGYLQSFFMSRTFSFLRANDLVYAPAIRSYMMGEAPPAFDLLYWNGDSTNLPGRMTVEYLRGLCQGNQLAKGTLELGGHTLSLKDVKIPIFSVACETDHIAAWKSCFNGLRQIGSRDKTFILSESGHIAGIVNPPSKKKYGHYTSDAAIDTPEDWLAGADLNPGSWWPRWETWLARRSGRMVEARAPGSDDFPPLCPAPGAYVRGVQYEEALRGEA